MCTPLFCTLLMQFSLREGVPTSLAGKRGGRDYRVQVNGQHTSPALGDRASGTTVKTQPSFSP
jgi:hypothetical protein